MSLTLLYGNICKYTTWTHALYYSSSQSATTKQKANYVPLKIKRLIPSEQGHKAANSDSLLESLSTLPSLSAYITFSIPSLSWQMIPPPDIVQTALNILIRYTQFYINYVHSWVLVIFLIITLYYIYSFIIVACAEVTATLTCLLCLPTCGQKSSTTS